MAAITASPRPRSLLGKVLGSLRARPPRSRRAEAGKLRAAVAGAVTAALPAVREHMTTVTAFGTMTAGVWYMSTAAGLIAAGVSLLLIDFKVRG